MFSQNEIDAYKKIKAPEELKEKVEMQMAQKNYKRTVPVWKMASVIVACFVLVIIWNSFIPQEPLNMTINGVELEDEVVFNPVSPALAMRTVPVCSIPIELELDEHKAFICVSDGFLTVNDGTPTEEMEVAGNVKIWWNIECIGTMSEYEMKIEHSGETTQIILEFNQSDGTIAARKSTKK